MLRIGTVVLGVDDLPRAVEFWTRTLDRRLRRRAAGGCLKAEHR
jgi:catechol 2,3-dioxygenase-like lactoylglutathione lyase family enzyme